MSILRFLLVPFVLLGLFANSVARAEPPVAAEENRILVLLRQVPDHFRPGADYGGSYGDALTRLGRLRVGRHIALVHGLSMAGDWPMPLLGLDCFIMAVPSGRTVAQAVAEVSRDPGVEWSQPMHLYRTKGGQVSYNDPLFPAQPAARQWHLATLHAIATGRGVTVAVIDTAIDRTQPDLRGQLALDADFVDGHPAAAEDHGTGVAGIIAAKGDNGVGIVGVAPGARIMALRGCWQLAGTAGSVCDSLSLAKALHFAIDHRARIINLSLGGPPDPLLARLIDIGLRRGETMVAAFDPGLPGGGFPASYGGVVAVADDAVVTVPHGVYTAPGQGIPTTEPGGRWYLVDGSSYAAAHVSGLLALIHERHPSAGNSVRLVAARSGSGVDALASLSRPAVFDPAATEASAAAAVHP